MVSLPIDINWFVHKVQLTFLPFEWLRVVWFVFPVIIDVLDGERRSDIVVREREREREREGGRERETDREK